MGILELPAASGNLELLLSIPSGCVGYIDYMFGNIASSGQTMSDFFVGEIIKQSMKLYTAKFIEINYANTISSGVALNSNHEKFSTIVMIEMNNLLKSSG